MFHRLNILHASDARLQELAMDLYREDHPPPELAMVFEDHMERWKNERDEWVASIVEAAETFRRLQEKINGYGY